MNLLLAEDERDLARALRVLLEHHHFDVDVVHHGDDALAYARSGRYDGLILDVMMPGPDGFEVLRQLRAEGDYTPTLFLTAKNQIEDKVEGLDLGADDYLTKPFDLKELLARVRAMLRRPSPQSPMLLARGDLKLDRESAVLSGPGGKIPLGPKEFGVMDYFMSNPLQILSADQIMEKVWGYDADAQINVVWVNISTLRNHLEDLGSASKIVTRRGLGYRFEPSADDADDETDATREGSDSSDQGGDPR